MEARRLVSPSETDYLIGVDGGGTRTTIALAEPTGREILRRSGPPGLLDPRDPDAAVERVADLVREAVAAGELTRGVGALCVGLAGVRKATEQAQVESALLRRQIARRVVVRSDGEIALQGALGPQAGILLIAGTGSVAWGRAEDGRVKRCGGWGLVMGDEGSGYAVGRASLRAAARSVDGRAAPSQLLDAVLEEVGVPDADALRNWASSSTKAQIASIARRTALLAGEGDPAASRILLEAASALAAHARALCDQLGPWTRPVTVVLHGGLTHDTGYARAVEGALHTIATPLQVRAAQADPVTGALQIALEASRRDGSGRGPAVS